MINELAKHATQKRLPPRDAERVIDIGIGRHRYGDHPDATLAALVDLINDRYYGHESWREKAATELLRVNPDNDEAAVAIIANVPHEDDGDEGENDDAEVTGGEDAQGEAADDDSEAEKILESPPPDAPPPAPARGAALRQLTSAWL